MKSTLVGICALGVVFGSGQWSELTELKFLGYPLTVKHVGRELPARL